MQYYRFNTQLQADDFCKTLTSLYLNSVAPCDCSLGEDNEKICSCDWDEYKKGTECWDLPVQRTSNTDWVIQICQHINNDSYDIIEIDKATEWPQEEE